MQGHLNVKKGNYIFRINFIFSQFVLYLSTIVNVCGVLHHGTTDHKMSMHKNAITRTNAHNRLNTVFSYNTFYYGQYLDSSP